MMDNKQKENILENVKLKISISNFEKQEKKARNFKEKFIVKNIGIAACVLISMSGVVFAGNKIVETIEKIWATPEKIENPTTVITEESKQENITEEEAKEIAINKLKELGFSTKIIGTRHYKDINSNKILYKFVNENQYDIEIDGQSGKFSSIWSNDIVNTHDLSVTMTVDEAKEVAMKYYKLLGFKENEYEITSIRSDHIVGSEEKPGHEIDIVFNKKYGEKYNPFESISICIHAKTKDFVHILVKSFPFDNNEIIITKDEAIEIALNEDAKIETDKCVGINLELMVVRMNSQAYERINNKEKYYEDMKGCPWEERTYYHVEDKVRNAWVVFITYDIYYNDEGRKRPNECQYSYFVDCTTGEIIGGFPGDYRLYAN